MTARETVIACNNARLNNFVLVLVNQHRFEFKLHIELLLSLAADKVLITQLVLLSNLIVEFLTVRVNRLSHTI